MTRTIPLYLIIVLGIAGIGIFGYFSLVDWDALQKTYANFETVAQNSPSLSTLWIAESQQNIHRINLFAEGTWVLLSAVVAAIGIHGICTKPRRSRKSKDSF